MKKLNLIFALILLSMSFTLNAQRTKGGSKKNYELYHVIRDTIYEEVPVPIERYNLGYFTVGPVLPNSLSKSLPADFWTTWESNGNWSRPLETGEIGAKTGFNITYGNFSGINFINKNLITDIEVGLESGFFLSIIPYNWSDLSSSIPTTYNDLDKDLFTDVLTKSKGYIGILGGYIGLGLLYHTPVDGMDVRISVSTTPSFFFSDLSSDIESIAIDDPANSLEYSMSVTPEYFEEGNSGFTSFTTFKFGVNYNMFYLGASMNTGGWVYQDCSTYHNLYFSYDDGSYFSGTWYRDFTTNMKLANISIDLGFAF
ncbi:MAG: hypothetical protein IPM74_14885 [Crocinitomicaceae bacterium]|nr:hypothetical protein [Crocinitomicaceae bacterium]MBK8927156.1 hypothetical protein [Crocinitomicaceae bacterium]